MKGLGFSGHGAPAIRARGSEAPGQQAEQGGVRTGRSEVDVDAGGPLDDAGSDLEQARPEGTELGPGERHPSRHGIAQGEHQPVGRGVQDEAELVGDRALAGGPVGGELALVQLDEVLGLAAGAVDIFIEMAAPAASGQARGVGLRLRPRGRTHAAAHDAKAYPGLSQPRLFGGTARCRQRHLRIAEIAAAQATWRRSDANIRGATSEGDS